MFSKKPTTGSNTVTSNNKKSKSIQTRSGITTFVNTKQVNNKKNIGTSRKLNNTLNIPSKRHQLINTTLLKNFSRRYLHSCFLNTYTTLAYLTGQSTISDAVLFRYIISFETLLSKINGNLNTNKEKIFENLWNKTRGYEKSNKFSTTTDIEQHLRYYKTIMKNGFKSPGNSRLAALSRNLK